MGCRRIIVFLSRQRGSPVHKIFESTRLPPTRRPRSFAGMSRSWITLACLLAFGACTGDARPADSAAGTAARDTTPVAAADGVTAGTPADSGCAAAPLADSAAGPVRLGMRVEEIVARCPGARDSTVSLEGTPARTLVVPVGDADTVDVSIVEGRAWRLAVATRGMRTRDSLGVGTPLARLLALANPRGLTGEGRTFVVADQPCGLSFELDRFVSRAAPDTASLRREAKGARVKRVLVTGCGAP
jgi:hypothetical protein